MTWILSITHNKISEPLLACKLKIKCMLKMIYPVKSMRKK